MNEKNGNACMQPLNERKQDPLMAIKLNYKERTIAVGDRIVEKGNVRQSPEW